MLDCGCETLSGSSGSEKTGGYGMLASYSGNRLFDDAHKLYLSISRVGGSR